MSSSKNFLDTNLNRFCDSLLGIHVVLVNFSLLIINSAKVNVLAYDAASINVLTQQERNIILREDVHVTLYHALSLEFSTRLKSDY